MGEDIEQTAMNRDIIKTEIWIPGRGVGKGRPRFSSSGKVHTGDRYGKWKRETIKYLNSTYPGLTIQTPTYIQCYFVNFLSSDADNLIGSVLDALVQAEIIENDSSSYVPGCSGEFVKIGKPRGLEKPLGILIKARSANQTSWDYRAIAAHLPNQEASA